MAAVDAVLDAVARSDDGACWSVFLLEHDRLWAVSHRGYTIIPDGLTLDRGVMARAVRERRAVHVPDVLAEPEYVAGRRGVASELVLPVLSGGNAVGVLNLETTFPLGGEAAAAVAPFAELLSAPLAELRASPALDLSSLARLFVHMSSLRDAAAIADLAARSLAHVLGLESAQVLISGEDDGAAAGSWSATGETHHLTPQLVERLRAHVDVGTVFELVDVAEAGLEHASSGAGTLAWLPLRVNGVEVGVLVGFASGGVYFPRRQAEAAALLAAQAAASLDAALALVRERRTAVTDPLTGLLNRRGFGDQLEHELETAGAGRRPLSLLVIDCDEFKAVNDRGGHERGDHVLVELGSLIRGRLPAGGFAARLGGDEFAVMLPDTDAAGAHIFADELRVAVSRGLAEAGTTLHVSVGVATYPFDAGTATQLLRAADQGLYVAKASGKDLVVNFRDLAEWMRRGAAARQQERRSRLRPVGAAETASVAEALAAETAPEAVLLVLCRSLTASLSATAALASRLDGDRVEDVAKYALRDIDLGEQAAYLLDDFPLTREVLTARRPRTMSFIDDQIDRAEAFVLRELNMNSLLMLPLVLGERTWGLVEVYDVRMRQFDDEDVAAAQQLTTLAARRLEELEAGGVSLGRSLPAAPVLRPVRGAELPGDAQRRAG